MTQIPAPEDFLLKWRGDTLAVTLKLETPRKGRAAFRTNLGHAAIRRGEIIAETERGLTPLAKAWTDIPLAEVAPGVFSAEIPLGEVGVFSGKACFFPEGSHVPEWPEGRNTHIKVESAETRKANSIYTVFPRQFGSFREIVRRLPVIMDTMGFRIVQTLPPFPVPTTYAVMGEYGCPFAATDFFSVDPAMAEFDERATPLDQFKELIGAVHARRGLFFIDLPANHTGWASTLQTHHPDWFRRAPDGRFVSPGAWGVTWADLVELDYSKSELRAYMAEVFVFWCRLGVDGFRCDAGYMIPAETWEYIVARVREEYPDTVFMLEGLGGKLEVTDRLLAESNLDWAYSELFQTYDRGQFEWYLPDAIRRSERYGALVHFAETHDNDRLAKGGTAYARLRVQLAALLSWQGAWGISNGVEWFCAEKIDVHGRNGLNWGAADNMVDLIAKLNFILATHPSFCGAAHLKVVTRGDGNTLAMKRDGLLILANLDCAHGCRIDWDRSKVPETEAFDLLTERKVDLRGPVALRPGEVLCLQTAPVAEARVPAAHETETASPALFHIRIPRDVRRDVVLPGGQAVEVVAPSDFRLRLIDPASGRTIRVQRSVASRAVFTAPSYEGDGTRCRELALHVSVYSSGRAERFFSRVFVPPPSERAAVKLSLSGDEVRRNPDFRTILSNGAGAAAQLRVGWGEIRSQYDATLAANPNPTCPGDRVNVWARTRCWLQREGYARELDRKCVTRFTADPAGRFARWQFDVPCGMGYETAFVAEVSLEPGVNAAHLRMTRVAAAGNDVGDQVRLVFRPDLEWRSFHACTKAYAGLEQLFPASSEPLAGAEGFAFHPYDGTFTMSVAGGRYHHEPQWQYAVGHPEEAARGQEGCGDLFSPGWISADLKVGETVELVGTCGRGVPPRQDVDDSRLLRRGGPSRSRAQEGFASALRAAMDLFIVRRDDLKTVIAGYPWFLDWGRDTFIFLRGMIAAGMCGDALKILHAFAAFEENGTLPNIIYGKTAGNRDTTDAPLWFIRCVQELEERVSSPIPRLRHTCASIVDHYISGTPNGIRMDAESGLVWSPSHFTWMDTNYPACTPRVGYPVEIQALWISALKYLGRTELAQRATASLKRYFKIPVPTLKQFPGQTSPTLKQSNNQTIKQFPGQTSPAIKQSNNQTIKQFPGQTSPAIKQSNNQTIKQFPGQTSPAIKQSNNQTIKQFPGQTSPAIKQSNNQTIKQFPGGYSDCLAAPHGEPAARAVPEDTVRPNQLLLLTLGVLDDPSILRATEELLVPGGIRSLNADNPLYRGTYAGDEDTSRKPAYHNGTVWGWQFPLYAEALVAVGGAAPEVGLQVLASAVENLNAGCLGQMSEIADGDAPHAQKGCTAQAWSVSELLRVWLKLGGK